MPNYKNPREQRERLDQRDQKRRILAFTDLAGLAELADLADLLPAAFFVFLAGTTGTGIVASNLCARALHGRDALAFIPARFARRILGECIDLLMGYRGGCRRAHLGSLGLLHALFAGDLDAKTLFGRIARKTVHHIAKE